jgi:methyl-accepting chemotaxis protein
LKQINVAVGQMDQLTQQNAEMVEEATAATRTLSEQTAELAELVSRFRTEAADAQPSFDMAGDRDGSGIRSAKRPRRAA